MFLRLGSYVSRPTLCVTSGKTHAESIKYPFVAARQVFGRKWVSDGGLRFLLLAIHHAFGPNEARNDIGDVV